MHRDDFAMLSNNIVYFDNGATTLKPKCVRDAICKYYDEYTANAHRGDYKTSAIVDSLYEGTREKIKNFINAKENSEIVFTSGTTNSMNIIVSGFFKNYLKKYDIKSNLTEKNGEYAIYLKDGEEISKFLALIGANKAVLKFEEIRVQREMNNKINRIVNCETANLNKTINASIEQIEAIKKLKKNKKFEKMDDSLKEIAELRLQNPNASLVELGKLLKQPVGKSGVNYRLKKIMEIANEK